MLHCFCRFISLPRKRLLTFQQKNHWKTSHHPARRRRSTVCGLCIVARSSWRRTQVQIMYTTSLLVIIPINLVTRCYAHALVHRTFVRNSASAALTVSISHYLGMCNCSDFLTRIILILPSPHNDLCVAIMQWHMCSTGGLVLQCFSVKTLPYLKSACGIVVQKFVHSSFTDILWVFVPWVFCNQLVRFFDSLSMNDSYVFRLLSAPL